LIPQFCFYINNFRLTHEQKNIYFIEVVDSYNWNKSFPQCVSHLSLYER